MMRNKSKTKKAKAVKKAKRVKVRKKISPTKRRLHAARKLVIPDIEASARVQESIRNYNQGDTKGFATIEEIWKFAESDK